MQNINRLAALVIASLFVFGIWFSYLINKNEIMEELAIKASQQAEKQSKESAEASKLAAEQMKLYAENARVAAENVARIQKQIEEDEKKKLVTCIIKTHKNVDKKTALKIVNAAFKYEQPTFPNRYHILAIMWGESGYNPSAKSNLKKDPALGLMQVRPIMWKLSPEKMKTNIDYQVKHAVKILSHYHDVLGNDESTLEAFNIGLQAVKNGGEAKEYVERYKSNLVRLRTSM